MRTVDADTLLTLLDAEITELQAVVTDRPLSDEARIADVRLGELEWARGLVETHAGEKA